MMREGLQPARPTHVARLVTTGPVARAVADLVGETFDPAETAVAAFEADDEVTWTVEIWFARPPDEAAVRDLVAVVAGAEGAKTIGFEAVAARDWVAQSLAGLAPVPAGRFVVHGCHDRGRAAPNRIALEIEAALAFGTGHHGTTRGCLLALDGLLKRRRPSRALDVGTGTGVLAIALARALRRRVEASDIDPEAVVTASDNARLNGVGPLVRPLRATGLRDRRIAGPYDLVFANILLPPLKRLARPIRDATAPGATVILSGLLVGQGAAATAAYRAQGFRLVRRIPLEGWVTLVLERGPRRPQPRAGG